METFFLYNTAIQLASKCCASRLSNPFGAPLSGRFIIWPGDLFNFNMVQSGMLEYITQRVNKLCYLHGKKLFFLMQSRPNKYFYSSTIFEAINIHIYNSSANNIKCMLERYKCAKSVKFYRSSKQIKKKIASQTQLSYCDVKQKRVKIYSNISAQNIKNRHWHELDNFEYFKLST